MGRPRANICDVTKHGASDGSVCKHVQYRITQKSEWKQSGWSFGEVVNLVVDMTDCAVFGCKPQSGASSHYLPKNPVLKQKWMDFIYKHRSSRPSNTTGMRICGAHFSYDCFVNYFQRSMGFAKRLSLKPDAVPSIYAGTTEELQHVSVSSYFTGWGYKTSFFSSQYCVYHFLHNLHKATKRFSRVISIRRRLLQHFCPVKSTLLSCGCNPYIHAEDAALTQARFYWRDTYRQNVPSKRSPLLNKMS